MPIFATSIPIGLGWQIAPDTGGAWARDYWWRIDIRSDDRIADVKWTWELGRHRHLLLLARASWLDPANPTYLELLQRELVRWLEENPPEHGVHWYSNLEISLRALVWTQILGLVGDSLPTGLRSEMHRHLYHSGLHLLADLPYTVSSMRNNHMLGDALGLIALGKAFDRPRWRSIGESLFRRQLARHMRSDGSMIEDSLSYHRFVTEMLAMRVLLGGAPAAVTEALAASGAYLARLGAFDGPLPQFGDWDEGRVLASSGDPHDVAGVAALALALSGTGATPSQREAYDECAWYAVEGTPLPSPPAVRDGGPTGGGFARAVHADWHVWLKAGGGKSHQHADLGSVTLRIGAQWVIGDPGTGTYNGPLKQRNAFRTSGAHSVLRLHGTDQLEPHRAFRWQHSAHGAPGVPPLVDDATVMWGVHDAYRRLPGTGRIVRVVVLLNAGMVVADVVEAAAGTPWDLTLPLHPAVTIDGDELVLPDDSRLVIGLPGQQRCSTAQDEPFEGWWSETYGAIRPTTWVHTEGRLDGPVIWTVRRPDSTRMHDPLPDGIRIGSTDLRVSFTADEVHLTAQGADTSQVRSIRTGR